MDNRLTEKTLAGETVLSEKKTFTYDDRDRLQSVTDAANPSLDTTFAYDLNGNQDASAAAWRRIWPLEVVLRAVSSATGAATFFKTNVQVASLVMVALSPRSGG